MTTSSTSQPTGSGVRPRPGRPRDDGIDELILGAAVALLDEGEEISVSKVVDRSGVSRAALYRRWPSITQLTAAALDMGRTQYPEVDLGAGLKDSLFEALLPGAGVASSSSTDYPMHRFIQRMKLVISDPQLQQAYWESHVAKRRQPLEETIRRAIADGLLREDVDPAAAVDALAGIAYYQIIVRGSDLQSAETKLRMRHAFELLWRGMMP